MKASALLGFLTLLSGALVSALDLPAGVPRSVSEFRRKHPYIAPSSIKRKKVTIRSSKTDTDDISDEFVKGLKKANHGGTLYLPEGHTYIIGKPLDLTWLDNVHIKLDGEIKFTNDTSYWQEKAFTHPFQVD
jgi:galacturan 1,4-alpha-galacturonidase